MSPSSCVAVSAAFLSLLVGGALGCASAPTSESTAALAPEAAAAVHDAHAHHAHHELRAEGALAESDAPTSFAERPEVGTEFTCPVSGGVFEVESHTRMTVYEGRHYAFCCGGCKQDFDADPAQIVEALGQKRE
jgi:YHS domain-containing protein